MKVKNFILGEMVKWSLEIGKMEKKLFFSGNQKSMSRNCRNNDYSEALCIRTSTSHL